ncbi:MAG: hypothetical protein JWL73_2246 [Actinomycetia bacterium]|nr:hypothetical protein [Actinomycetes bacterium]
MPDSRDIETEVWKSGETLDEEGVPDLNGPLDEKAATGDPQEGQSPPGIRPRASVDFGTTAEEQREGEGLDGRLSREVPDVFDEIDEDEERDPEDIGDEIDVDSLEVLDAEAVADDEDPLAGELVDGDTDDVDAERDPPGPWNPNDLPAEEQAVHVEHD